MEINNKGKERLKPKSSSQQPANLLSEVQAITLKDLIYQNESEVKNRIIAELKTLKPKEFEQFCYSLLGLLGYQELEVTSGGP